MALDPIRHPGLGPRSHIIYTVKLQHLQIKAASVLPGDECLLIHQLSGAVLMAEVLTCLLLT